MIIFGGRCRGYTQGDEALGLLFSIIFSHDGGYESDKFDSLFRLTLGKRALRGEESFYVKTLPRFMSLILGTQ